MAISARRHDSRPGIGKKITINRQASVEVINSQPENTQCRTSAPGRSVTRKSILTWQTLIGYLFPALTAASRLFLTIQWQLRPKAAAGSYSEAAASRPTYKPLIFTQNPSPSHDAASAAPRQRGDVTPCSRALISELLLYLLCQRLSPHVCVSHPVHRVTLHQSESNLHGAGGACACDPTVTFDFNVFARAGNVLMGSQTMASGHRYWTSILATSGSGNLYNQTKTC